MSLARYNDPMKYSLRSLMIVTILAPPVLAMLTLFVPPLLKHLFATRAPIRPPVWIIVSAPGKRPTVVTQGSLPKSKLPPRGDFPTPEPALRETLESDNNWPSDRSP